MPMVNAEVTARNRTQEKSNVKFTFKRNFTLFPAPPEDKDILTSARTKEVNDTVTCPRHLTLNLPTPVKLCRCRSPTHLSSRGSANTLRRPPTTKKLVGLTKRAALTWLFPATSLPTLLTR